MMLRSVLVCVALLVLAVPAEAQVHPCDVVPPNNPNLTSPVKGAFCHNNLDSEGNTIIVTAFRLYIDGTLVFNGPLVPIGPPTTDGRFYYESPPIVVARGAHTSTATAVSADGESAHTAPYPFVIVGAPPAPPSNHRIKK